MVKPSKAGIPPRNPEFRDFRNFMHAIWKYLGLPDPTRIQYDIGYRLQHGPMRDIIQAQRGEGKSWIGVTFTGWLLYWWPQIRILLLSASATKANENATFLKYLIDDVPWLQWLAPTGDQRDAKVSFDVGPAGPSQAPSVKSSGIFGQITGSRAHMVLPDDIEIPKNSDTQLMRDQVEKIVTELDAILGRRPDDDSPDITIPRGIKYLGTPQTELTLYRKLVPKGYSCRIWTSRYPTPKRITSYGEHLAPLILEDLEKDPSLGEPKWGIEGNMGAPVDPGMFDEEDLQERELSFGRSGYELQYQLNPSLADGQRYPLKLRDLIIMTVNDEEAPEKPVWAPSPSNLVKTEFNVGMEGDYFYGPMEVRGGYRPYTGSVMWVDPAGRGKDLTSFIVLKMLHGYLYVPAKGWGGFLGGYEPATLEALADLAKHHKVNVFGYENNFGDGMFGSLMAPYLNRIHPCRMEEVRSSRQKELRICDTLEPVVNQHRLVMDPSLIEDDFRLPEGKDIPLEQHSYYRGFYQFTRMERVRNALRHEDLVDVMAQGVAYWMEQMNQDADARIEENEQEDIKAQLEDWLTRPANRMDKGRQSFRGDSGNFLKRV